MATIRRIRRQGEAVFISVPAALFDRLGVSVGSKLDLEVRDGVLIARPRVRKRRRYTLAELLEGSEALVEFNRQASVWQNVRPVGNEIF